MHTKYFHRCLESIVSTHIIPAPALNVQSLLLVMEIRSVTDKKIVFDRETARGFQRIPSMEVKIVPQEVSGLVYGPHLYSVPTQGSQGEKQVGGSQLSWYGYRSLIACQLPGEGPGFTGAGHQQRADAFAEGAAAV